MVYSDGVHSNIHMGRIADQMRAELRAMAQSDAHLFRSIDQYSQRTQALLAEMRDDSPALPATDPIADAITLLEANGYTVTK